MTVAKPNTFTASSLITAAGHNQNYDALFTTLGLKDYDLEHNAAGTHKTITAPSIVVSGAGSFGTTLLVTGAFTASSTAAITGNTTVGGTLGVTGVFTAGAALNVTGAATLSSTLAVTGAATLSSTLAVTGASTLTGNTTITGTLTANGKAVLKGTATNDNAASGYYGEYKSATATTNSVGTTAQYFDVTSIDLEAGDWDVTGVISYIENSATMSGANFCGISTTSGNSATGLSVGNNLAETSNNPTSLSNETVIVPSYRVSIASTTTFYLKGFCRYTAGTPQHSGRISARRMR